jgi:hypothetical protein
MNLPTGDSQVLQNLRHGSSYLFGPAVRLGNILALWLSMMINDADRDRIRELCSLIAVEQDRQELLKLIEELSRHIGAKDEGLKVKQIGN